MNAPAAPKPKMIWTNILFFAVTTFASLILAPVYLLRFHPHPLLVGLTLFYILATSMSITAGYHRLFSHATYKANPILQFLFLFFGAAAYQQSALRWASQHRTHHLYVDTDKDPYSIKKGFFYAHIGWLLFWQQADHYENAIDLKKNRLVVHQHRYYPFWSAGAGIVLPMLIGYAIGDLPGAFLFPVCARLVFVHHATFAINSICHTFGKATYDIYSTAKDHWLVAFITNGEGYHNFHHHFPSDYRNGVRWYQWDPSKWLIAVFAWSGLAWDLKRVSAFRIIAARLAADQQRAEDDLKKWNLPDPSAIKSALKFQYERLKETLSAWEVSAREYQAILRAHLERHSERRRQAALKRIEARRLFNESLHQWKALCLRTAVTPA